MSDKAPVFDPAKFMALAGRQLGDYLSALADADVAIPRSFYESVAPSLDSLDDFHLICVIAAGANDAPDIIGPHIARFMETRSKRSVRLAAIQALARLPSITPADYEAAERFVASYPANIAYMLQDLASRVKQP